MEMECDGKFELNRAFREIDVAMTTIENWSTDSKVSDLCRSQNIVETISDVTELAYGKIRNEVEKQNKPLKSALFPRSNVFQGHATEVENDEIKGTVVSIIPDSLAKGREERIYLFKRIQTLRKENSLKWTKYRLVRKRDAVERDCLLSGSTCKSGLTQMRMQSRQDYVTKGINDLVTRIIVWC